MTANPPAPESSEERYRAFIEQTAEGVWRCELREPVDVHLSVDAQIDAVYAHAGLAECNDAMARMYGLDGADQIVGVALGDLLPRDDPANLEYLRAFIRSGYRLTDAESHEIGSDGRSRYFLNNLVGIVRGGRLIRAWGSQRDIRVRAPGERRALPCAGHRRHRTGVDRRRDGTLHLAAGVVGAVHRAALGGASRARLDGGAPP